MRPVRLVLQAFGPYAGRQMIDFQEAVAAGLFGIYGQTGSGKSTIFSAMSFALFGEAARSEQETISLRSDHAAPDLPTEVEFVFDLGERRYLIRRRPDQMRPKQRGGGETRDAHEAWLFDATGLPLDEIDADKPGKLLAEKKVGLVREAVTSLLGYGPEQFKQIVLLPQGRFEAFLAAKTQERQDILGALFDVSLYRRLASKLKAEAEVAERQVRDERAVCLGRLAADGFESMAALDQGIAEAAAQFDEKLQAEQQRQADLGAAQAQLHEARATDDLFKAAAQARQAQQRSLDRVPEITALKAQVTAAERARVLAENEERVIAAEREWTEAKDRLDSLKALETIAFDKAQQASDLHRQHLAGRQEMDTLGRSIEQLQRDRDRLAKAAGLTTELEAARRYAAEIKDAFETLETDLARRIAKRQGEEQALKQARIVQDQRQSVTARLATLERDLKQAEMLERAERDLTQARRRRQDQMHRQAERQKASAEAAALFEAAERRLASAQALHLAAKLAPGAPCPVCGATDHPQPAQGDIYHAGLTEAFREAKQAMDAAYRDEQAGAAALASADATIMERERQLSELERPERDIQVLRQDWEETGGALKALGPTIDIATVEARLEAFAKNIAEADAELHRRRDLLAAAKTETSTLQARVADMLEGIDPVLRDPAVLDRRLRQSTDLLANREKALVQSEQSATETREAALAARKDREAGENLLAERQERMQREILIFETRLSEAALTRADLQRLKPAIATLDRDKGVIDDYQRELHRIGERLAELEAALVGKEQPDMASLEASRAVAEAALKIATDQRATAAARARHLQRLRQDLSDIARRLDEAEAASGPLREMSALFDAQNRQKLKLETFAIGAMFEQVLRAANLRLGPMTNGRYRLERDIESGGRGKRGLGILAFDIHTGKARPTATLSGGETFIAALALALGLADVVESASGKVRLDTIFLDEGFGSLDTENGSGTLDLVLQALNSLASQNRSVGLISHVPLVQEAIPNGFYVRKDRDGSHIEKRGLM